ncbi:MAG: AzlD domain-containing protein [Burkholderiales bacterium]|nr:AzlD domain-containing protein [Burkholderiales bacterium]
MTSPIAAHYGWTLWLIFGGMALLTFANRAGLLLLAGRFRLPKVVEDALRFAPAAALAAIVAPDLLLHGGRVDLSLDNARLYAGLAGFAVALVLRSTMLAIGVGMLALFALARIA